MLPIDDPAYVKAMGHPVRVRVMAMLQERQASPSELSNWLRVTLGSVCYHVGLLHRLDLIELVAEERVRGAVKHHYRAKHRVTPTEEDWANASPVAKKTTVSSQLGMLDAHTHAAAAAGGFDRPDAVIARKVARVDAKGWTDLNVEATSYLNRIDTIAAEAAQRIAKTSDDDVLNAGVVVLSFESTSLASQIPGPRKTREPNTTGSRAA